MILVSLFQEYWIGAWWTKWQAGLEGPEGLPYGEPGGLACEHSQSVGGKRDKRGALLTTLMNCAPC
jgi:hypothetical protein